MIEIERLLKVISKHQKLVLVFFVIFVMSYSLVLRFRFDFPELSADAQRDYFVAHHIVKYHESTLIGPWNSILGKLSSPLYFYLLAFFLAIKDEILFLQIINIALQAFTAGLIYLLGKTIFSLNTGLIASILYVASATVLYKTSEFNQSAIMIPFLTLSYLLFAQAYSKKNYLLLLTGAFSFSFSGTIHNAVFGLLLPVILISFFIIKKFEQPRSTLLFFGFLAVLFGSILLFYIPTIVFFIENQIKITNLSSLSFSDNFPINFFRNLSYVIRLFFLDKPGLTLFSNLTLIATSITALIYFTGKIGRERKILATVLIAGCIIIIGQLSLLKIGLQPRYLFPIYSLFIIFVAEIINSVFGKPYLAILKILLVTALVYTFSQELSSLRLYYQNPRQVGPIQQIIKSVKSEVLEIQEKDQRQIPNFFQVKIYQYPIGFNRNATEIYNAIEKELGFKYGKINHQSSSSNEIATDNKDDYIFLLCFTYLIENKKPETCSEKFFKSNPDYLLEKKVFSKDSLHVYLAKKLQGQDAAQVAGSKSP